MPRNLIATVNSPQSISLMWIEPESINGRLLMYIVTTRSGEDVSSTVNITDASSTEFTVETLIPSVLYTFEVVAVTGAGSGSGAEINATTDQAGKSDGYNYSFLRLILVFICSTFVS